MKNKINTFKLKVKNLFEDFKLKILILYISLNSKKQFNETYKVLTKIRKSKLQYPIKKVMIKRPIPKYFGRNSDDLILKDNWNMKLDRVKEIISYHDELNKPHVEATLHGYYGNSSPIFYVPEIVDIHNESLNDINGPDLNTLIKEENVSASETLKWQKEKLDRLELSERKRKEILKPKQIDSSEKSEGLELKFNFKDTAKLKAKTGIQSLSDNSESQVLFW